MRLNLYFSEEEFYNSSLRKCYLLLEALDNMREESEKENKKGVRKEGVIGQFK